MSDEELLNELVNDSNFQTVERLLNSKEPNIFKILKLEGNEIRHSNFLAWLLDPRGNHGLGSNLVKSVLREAGLDNIDNLTCDDAVVEREKDYIDLLVYSPKEKWCLVIENKTWTKDHGHQLNRYAKDVKYYFSGYQPLFVYLTPAGEEPTQETDDTWKCVGYKYIKDELQRVLEDIRIDNKQKNYIEDYLKLLEDDLLMENDKTRRDLCIDLYKKHKEAIDMINGYIGDEGAMRSKQYYDVLNSQSDTLKITMGVSTNKYTRFIPNVLEEANKGLGKGWSEKNSYLILYEVQCDKYTNELKLQIVLGPAVYYEKKEKLLNKLNENDLFKNAKAVQRANRKKKYDTAYIWIYEHTIVNKSKYEEMSVEEVAAKLVEYIGGQDCEKVTSELLKILKTI